MRAIEALLKKVQIKAIVRGFLNLNLLLLPVSLLLVGFLSIMGGGAPNSPGAAVVVGTVALYVYGFPAALTVALVAGAKIFDVLFRVVPLTTPEISWLGIITAAIVFVVWANIVIDHLFQFNRGEYQMSLTAIFLCIAGMGVLAWFGERPIPRLSLWRKKT